MAHRFKVVPRATIGMGAWDQFVQESSEAWLYHTSLWQAAGDLVSGDRSFGLVNESGVLRAIVAMQSQRIPQIRRAPLRRLHNNRCGLARANAMDESEKAEVDAAAIDALLRIGRREGALLVNWELPTMAAGPDAPSTPALVHFGFEVRSVAAKVIDLTQTDEALWKDYRKGCKSTIKKAQREGVRVSSAVSLSEVETFAALHAETMRSVGGHQFPAGYVTRLWSALSGTGHCEVLLARLPSGTPVAGVMTMTSKGVAYYHSAGSAQAHRDSGGNTLLIHEAILRARARGDQTFHLGATPNRDQTDEKTYLVGRFKNQFGGFEIPWRTASLFLWPGLAQARTMMRKLRQAATPSARKDEVSPAQ